MGYWVEVAKIHALDSDFDGVTDRIRVQMSRPDATERDLGVTSRGESIIADFDKEGRIIGLELVGLPKPCQR